MARIGAGSLTRRHPLRRYLMLALFLLALIAPAGWVVAGEFSQPYIVLFDPSAVNVPIADSDELRWGAGHSFRRLAASTAMRDAAATSATTTAGVERRTRVDGPRVVNHVREIAARSRVRVNSVYTNAVGGFAAELTPSQLRAVANDPAVSAVMPDLAVEIDDGSVGKEAGILRSVNRAAWQVPAGVRRIGARSSKITTFSHRATRIDADVAILDTGLDRDHPDLNVVGGYNCTGRNRDKWDDVEGHGTHVAGIVGALDNRIGVVGVAPGVRLWSVKVLDSRGRGFMSWIVCGIDWVTAQRDPRNPSRPLIEVANMSISFGLYRPNDADCGGPGRDGVHQAICRSVAAGTVYVVAAGNNSRNARRNRPAAYDEVITVSAMADYDGRGGGRGKSSDSCPYWSPEQDDSFTDFSNYGPDVDLIAPGRCVLSTYFGKRYAWMSGTSMAAPHVTGAAAIYRAMYPRTTPGQVRLALMAVGTLDWRTNTDPDGGTPEKAVWIGDFRRVPDFTLDVQPAADAVVPGGRLALEVQLDRVGGFGEPITISLADPPAGLSAERVVVPRRAATLYVDVADRARTGMYSLTVVARSADVVHRVTVQITVRRRVRSGGNDFTPPRAPSVTLAAGSTTIDLSGLALPNAHVGTSGTLWVRGGVSGSVELRVSARDPESGISAYRADISGDGWRSQWLGDSTEGRLRLTYTAGATVATLLVSSINGAGLESRATVGQLRPDADSPSRPEWISLPSSTTQHTRSTAARLHWSAGADEGAGLGDLVLVRRYRAPLNRAGHFAANQFSADGPYRLIADGISDTDLAPGYCYVWAIRALDKVGNASHAVVSGYLVVERGR